LDEGVEVGDEGVEVIWGRLSSVRLVVGVYFEGLLPFIFEFGVGVVSGGGWGRYEVEASDWVKGQRQRGVIRKRDGAIGDG
jgi:hypothetical protein